MKNYIFIAGALGLLLTSCVSQQKYTELESLQQNTKELLDNATVNLNATQTELSAATERLSALSEQNNFLRANNQDLIDNIGNLTTLTQKGAENLERSLESIREKDLIITRMQDAVTKRDSVTLALVQSFKSSLGTLSDDDIEINVEKGVVYVSISDKLLFNSGSFTVTTRARGVLEKIAKVISDKPDLEFMVEGHTDNMPIDQEKAAESIPGVVDNWDLSVKRATSVVRILQNSYGVDPTKLVAAGRSFYMPIADNDSSVTRAANRRTRIIVLPKLDQFTKLIEEGMSMNVPATGPSDTISSDSMPD